MTHNRAMKSLTVFVFARDLKLYVEVRHTSEGGKRQREGERGEEGEKREEGRLKALVINAGPWKATGI